MHASSSTSSSDRRPAREVAEEPRKAWKFPVAALAALILVGGFEAAVWKYRYWMAWDANYILLEQKRKAMTKAPKPDTVAIFGMSRFYHVDPKPIQALLGADAKITNYSWGWCGIEAYEAMLRGLIQAERVPKVILVDGIPEIFGYRPELVNARENEIFQIGLAQTAPRPALLRTQVGLKEWSWAWETIARTMSPPSTLYRNKVSESLKILVKDPELPPLPVGYDQIVEPWQEKGWFVFAPGRQASEEDFKVLEQLTGPYKLYKNKSAKHAYQRFVGLAEEHGVQVILLPVPNNPLIYAAYEREGVFAEYDQWLTKLEQKHKNFKAPAPRWLNWPESMGDAGHVHEAGAQRHMQLVIDKLRNLNIAPIK